MSSTTPRLSFGRKIGFTVGDYGFNLYWKSVSIFLLFYYTDVVGLSATTAGMIYMAATIFDAVMDLVIGGIADRTRTRWGRYRPYILLGAAPLGLSFAALYYKPAADGLALTGIVLGTHLVFRLMYAAVSIPYLSLTARVTQSSEERSSLAGFRMMFATMGGLTVSFVTQPLVAWMGQGDAAKGFFYVACTLAAISTAILPIVFLSTREPDLPSDEAPKVRLKDYWRLLRTNRAFWIVMIGVTCTAVSSTVISNSVLYYYKYLIGDEASARYALSVRSVAGLAIIPMWIYVTKFIGKRQCWFLASAWGLLCLSVFSVIDVRGVSSAVILFLLLYITSLGLSMTYWSMLPDTVEYGEWKSGLRSEAIVFGFASFFQKLALGMAAGLFGWALDFVGYVPNISQTPETLAGIKYIMVVLPAVALATGMGAMWFHPLRPGVHEHITRQLIGRRSGDAGTGRQRS